MRGPDVIVKEIHDTCGSGKGGEKKSKIVVTGNQTRSEEQEESSNIGLDSIAF